MAGLWLVGVRNLVVLISSMKVINSLLNNIPKMGDQSLDRPGSRVAQGADGMSLHLFGKVPEHINLCVSRSSLPHSLQNIHQPIGSLAAGSALAARLMRVEFGQSQNCLDRIDLSVHHDDRGRSQAALLGHQRVEVHQNLLAVFLGKHPHRGSARNDCQEIIPASLDPSCMSLDNLPQRNAHLLFHSAGIVHVPRDAEELCSVVVLSSEWGEPGSPSPQYCWGYRDCLHVGDSCRAAVETRVRGEGRLQSWLSRFALQALNQGRFLPADVGSSACMDEHIKVVPRPAGVFAKKSLLIGLIYCSL